MEYNRYDIDQFLKGDMDRCTYQYAEKTSNKVEGADNPHNVNRVKNEFHWWSSNEEGREVNESLRIADSISSSCSSFHFLDETCFSKTSLFMKLELNLFWIECKLEDVNWRRVFSGVLRQSSKIFCNTGVSKILDRDTEGPQLRLNLLVNSHFSNIVDKCDTGIFSVFVPITHVLNFFGVGLSSNNSNESTSWKYALSLSKFGSINFPCKNHAHILRFHLPLCFFAYERSPKIHKSHCNMIIL